MDKLIAKKSLGQNFLNSDGALTAILEAGKVKKGDTILEIGPGKGALTKRLLETGSEVFAVEKDDRLIPILEELFAKEIKSGKFTLIHKDILDVDLKEYGLKAGKYKLIANIPYYITGEITRKFLSGDFQPSLIVILVQKEVAERVVVKDGKESILSISVKAYGEPKYIQTVKAGSFFPPPKVDSAILLIDNISKNNFKETGEETFFKIVKAGFAHKRKTISSNLKAFVSKEKLAKLGINEKERAERLSLDQWLEISSKTY